ncbi:MAG TPA: hypothetical protein VGP47_04555 [Parachlamydiaceae bacterium]|nr:hypothetical protein [Parachlamydiaceae bacterium]
MINSSSSAFVHNLNTILNLQGTNLTVDAEGLLQAKVGNLPVEPSPGFFTTLFGTGSNRIEQVVNETCTRLFEEIINKNKAPLVSTCAALTNDRITAGKILDRLELLGNVILNPQLKADLKELVDIPETLEARLALRQGITPEVLNKTSSGTYIMRNRQGKPWGIFKPQCQEIGGSKNPSWVIWAVCTSEQWGIEEGTGYLRECAAYSLDKNHFSNVPLTVSTHFQHPALDTSIFPISTPNLTGSFQLFKDNCKPGNECLKKYEIYSVKLGKAAGGSVLYSMIKKAYVTFFRFLFFCGLPHLPVNQVHRMAILDIRLLNCDRHFGNFLFDKISQKLFPIDHGLILPANATKTRFDWKQLIQSHIPFSNEELAYIDQLNADEDEKILIKCGINCLEALGRMKLSTALLKECAKRGMTAHQIADLMVGKRITVNGNYFEDVICKEVFKKGLNRDVVIRQAISDYLG